MSDGIEVSEKSIADPKYNANNPHPEYQNLVRGMRHRRNNKKYIENYNKIDWSDKSVYSKDKKKEEPKSEPDKYDRARDILGLDEELKGDLKASIGHAIGYWYTVRPNEVFDDRLAVIMCDMLTELAEGK